MARKKVPENYEKTKQGIIQAALMCVFPIKFYLESYSESHVVKTLIKSGYEKYNALITAVLEEGIRNGEFQTCLPVSELAKFITGAIDGLAFQNLLVSSEKPEVPRSLLFSVLDHILPPIHPPPRKEVSND